MLAPTMRGLQNCKLIAAHSCDDVVAAHRELEPARDFLEHLVAGCVSRTRR